MTDSLGYAEEIQRSMWYIQWRAGRLGSRKVRGRVFSIVERKRAKAKRKRAWVFRKWKCVHCLTYCGCRAGDNKWKSLPDVLTSTICNSETLKSTNLFLYKSFLVTLWVDCQWGGYRRKCEDKWSQLDKKVP